QVPDPRTLPPYGFCWFLLGASAEPPPWSVRSGSAVEYHPLVRRDGLADVLESRERQVLERDILPGYIAQRHWYRHKGSAVTRTTIVSAIYLPEQPELIFANVEASCAAGLAVYVMPLMIAWDDKLLSPFEEPLALARVRKHARLGYLTDALAAPGFVNLLLHWLKAEARLPAADGELIFTSEGGAKIPELAQSELEWIDRELA